MIVTVLAAQARDVVRKMLAKKQAHDRDFLENMMSLLLEAIIARQDARLLSQSTHSFTLRSARIISTCTDHPKIQISRDAVVHTLVLVLWARVRAYFLSRFVKFVIMV